MFAVHARAKVLRGVARCELVDDLTVRFVDNPIARVDRAVAA
jgi:hypothetical protein